jgi:hypothetical protein
MTLKKYNHGDESQVENARLDEEIEEEQELRDIRTIMNTPEGKRMFRKMFNAGHIEDPFFKGNSSDAHNLGMRAIVLYYWNLCKSADPATFYNIVLENEDG